MNTLRDYKLVSEMTAVGSGSARWCFAEKKGKTYFIKEFLSPVYPSEDLALDPQHREKLEKACNSFFSRKNHLYDALRRQNNGNIITIEDFFLEKNKYYAVSKKVDSSDVCGDRVYTLSEENRLIIMKALVHCLRNLNKERIVHADLKLDNVMIKKTASGYYTIKLIDFDNSFFEYDVPDDPEQIGADFVYLAPEVFAAMNGEKRVLNYKLDIFALGIMFHQFWSGKLPKIISDDDEEYYVYEGILFGDSVVLDPSIPEKLNILINSMLKLDPNERPDYDEIFMVLNELSGMKPRKSKEKNKKKYEEIIEGINEEIKKSKKFLKPCGKL